MEQSPARRLGLSGVRTIRLRFGGWSAITSARDPVLHTQVAPAFGRPPSSMYRMGLNMLGLVCWVEEWNDRDSRLSRETSRGRIQSNLGWSTGQGPMTIPARISSTVGGCEYCVNVTKGSNLKGKVTAQDSQCPGSNWQRPDDPPPPI